MGRRPNPMILAYFQRGEKLSDASNRYQYACKGCGLDFPKGRTEVLFSHITNSCTALSNEQRMHVAAALAEPRSLRLAPEIEVVSDTTNPYERPKLTGLEALAEASRRVGHAGQVDEDNILIDPALQDCENIIRNQLAASIGYIPEVTCTAETLSSIAASASNLEESLPRRYGVTMVEVPDGADEEPPEVVEAMAESQALRSAATWSGPTTSSPSAEEVARAATFPRASQTLRKGPLRTNSGNGERAMRVQKARGKFTDTRRKEVLEIRKKGACIRCRILRKTCSDGDPCNSCSNVETARLWKTPCMRTRLSKAFDLYSDDPFERIASNNIEALGSTFYLQDGLVRISLRHASDSRNAIQFAARIAVPQFAASHAHASLTSDHKYAILASEMQDRLPRDLKNLLYESSSNIHQEEPFEIVRCSLKEAECLHQRNHDDAIVAGALYLWDLTHFLTSPLEEWIVTDLGGSMEPGPKGLRSQAPDGHPLAQKQTSVVFTQLRSLASKHAAECFNTLVNSIENLLIRPTASTDHFSAFISAFCLFACVERMEAWVRSFTVSNIVQLDKEVDSKNWPFPHVHPSHYISQAAFFVDLLSTLLKLRGVPPRFYSIPDTEVMVAAPNNSSNSRKSGGNGTAEAAAASVTDEDAARWFGELNLTEAFLLQRRDGAEFDAGDVRSLELKHCARLLV